MAGITLQPWYRQSWALVIGINVYHHASPLSYACNDADAVAAALIEHLGFPPEHVTILKDNVATKQTILDTYLSFYQKANDCNDRVVVFFAGHGTTISGVRGPIGYLVPVDADPDNLNSLIRWDEFTRNAELIPAKHILFIMDACYSGLAMQRVVAPGTERFLSDMLQRRARQVLTAGKADETVADGGGPQGKNSIFTGYLLEGLSGTASDKNGVLTANALMYYVYQRVGQDGRSQQTPHYGHIDGDGDFILRTPGDEHLRPDAQGDLLVETTPEMPEPISVIATIASPTFAQKNGYGDPTHPSFGRNDWSKMLGEQRFIVNAPREIVRAFSWLSLIVEPASNRAITIDIAEKASHLPRFIPADAKPHERFPIPRERRTTANSLVLYDEWVQNPQLWRWYLRFDEAGNIEYACTGLLMAEDQPRGVRYFCYVTLIGIIWQFLFWAKNFLVNAGYTSGIRLLVNLVGTRDTILAQFSREPGEGNRVWQQPLYNSFGIDTGVYDLIKCRDPHLQLEYQLVIGSLTETEAQQLIENIARKLGLAYNHNSSPRCFNANTNVFPWTQYLESIR